MLDTPDTARRIQSLKEALQGRTFGSGTLKASELGEVFAAAGIGADRLAGDGAAKYAACAELLHRQSATGTKPRRLADSLVELGYTVARIERVLAMRGAKLRDEFVSIFRRARAAGMSPDPYLACTLILSDGTDESAAEDTRKRIVGEYHRLAAA